LFTYVRYRTAAAGRARWQLANWCTRGANWLSDTSLTATARGVLDCGLWLACAALLRLTPQYLKRLSRQQNRYGGCVCRLWYTRWGAHWRNLANTIEPSVCVGDAALLQSFALAVYRSSDSGRLLGLYFTRVVLSFFRPQIFRRP